MPEFAMIPCNQLRLDPSYQREVDDRRVQSIVAHYDESLLGTLDVVGPGPIFTILDGGHRWTGTVIARGEHVALPCNVHESMTTAEQASKFVALNTGRKSLGTFDLHKARLAAGENTALEVQRIVEAEGFHLSSATGALRSVKALRQVYEAGGASALEDVMRMCAKAWGSEAPNASAINALGRIVMAHEDRVDREHLADVLRSYSYRQWEILGREDRLATGQHVAGAVANRIIASYNRGLRGAARLPAFTRGFRKSGTA